MLTLPSLKHARQAVADNHAAQAHIKATIGKILDTAGAKRTDEQKAALEKGKTDLSALEAEAADISSELARLTHVEQDALRQATGGQPVAPSRGRKYAEMFPSVRLDAGGFRSSDEFLSAIHGGLADQRLIPAYEPGRLGAVNTGTVPSDGGFSVPTQFFAQWLDASLENEIVRSRADVRPMTGSDAKAPGWDDGDHSDTLYGGFSGEWLAETEDMTVQTPKLRLINLHARKLGILARVSNELIADGMSFEAQLGQAITKALGWFLDRAFFSANGSSSPLGILHSGLTITVNKENNQAAATINYYNLAKMFARMHPSSHANSVWVCNSTAIPSLLTLGLPVGTGGSHVPVLTESGGEFRMLTRPVLFTEKVPALGTVGDIGLYDFTQYVVGVRADFSLAKSMHLGFASDTSYYRGIIRVDGQPKRAEPITPLNGDTLSPFVVLQTRA
jgi:HK97 family phage major capsid protein